MPFNIYCYRLTYSQLSDLNKTDYVIQFSSKIILGHTIQDLETREYIIRVNVSVKRERKKERVRQKERRESERERERERQEKRSYRKGECRRMYVCVGVCVCVCVCEGVKEDEMHSWSPDLTSKHYRLLQFIRLSWEV